MVGSPRYIESRKPRKIEETVSTPGTSGQRAIYVPSDEPQSDIDMLLHDDMCCFGVP